MQKVICISERKNSNQIEVGNFYYINLTSICSDCDGEWYVDVYKEASTESVWVGRFNLNHFKYAV